ncbi:MAG: hypothetical protein PHN99_06395 [Eubacteriales bacterium]|nr:hypothetical protein [Eubacteriales bacterium]
MRKGFESSALILSVFLLLTVMTACSPIEDTNGTSDKTLAQITDSELATKVSGSISKGSSSMKGTPTINREINDDIISDDDYDYDEIEFDFTRLNGTVKAMAAYLRVGDKMTVDFSSQITSGNFAAVIVSPDKTILKRFEADESGSANITASSEGDHFVIIAGESAAGSVSVIRSFEQEG